MKTYRRIKSALSLFGTANWYKGCEKVTFLDWLYRRRISLKTAWEVAKIVHS